MAPGAAQAVRRGAPLARRPSPPPHRAVSRVLPAGRPGRRGRALRAGARSAGSSGLGRAACALSPWSVHPRAGSAAPRLLCLTGRAPGAPPAPGRLAWSAERGAQTRSAARRRAALPSWGSRPGAPRPRLPGPTTWLGRCRRHQREGEREGGRREVGRGGRGRREEVGRGREVESWGREAGSEVGKAQAWGLTALDQTRTSRLAHSRRDLGQIASPLWVLVFLKVGIIMSLQCCHEDEMYLCEQSTEPCAWPPEGAGQLSVQPVF